MAEFKLGRLRFVWKGTWVTGTTYVKDDIVKYGGTSYVCMSGHTANANFNVDITASRWQVMSSGMEWSAAPWTASTVYKLNDLVKYGGRVYICTANHTASMTQNGGFYTDEAANRWDLFADGTNWTGVWLPSTYYKIGDLVKYNGRTYVCTTPHTSVTVTYLGESIDDIVILDGGSGYVNGANLVISAPDLVGGTQAVATITANGFGTITGINITNSGSGYTTVPTVTGATGNGASLVAVITESFVSGLEANQGDWEIFTEGFKWRGDWNGSQVPGSRVSTDYAVNDVVKFGASLYLCVTPHTSNATAFEESKWSIFVAGLEFEDSWSALEEYQLGDIVTYGGYAYTAIARNTAQIPPTSPGFWNLLTTGFNNRGVYVSTQSYKVGDLVQYGGNTYVAVQEVSANESPYSEPTNWEKITDGFRWRNEWDSTPTEPTYKIGDVVRYLASTYLVINEHIPSDEGSTLTATTTSSTSNSITCSGTDLLNPDQPIVFSGTGFGNITPGVTYYVKAVISSNAFSISETQGGSTKVLSNASGSLLGTFTSRPDLDDGTFFNSFAEGDANNVLNRRGDLVTRNAIQNVRLAKGQSGSFLKAGDQDLEWDLVGRITRVFYVSTDGVDEATRGTTLSDPWRTIKYACDFVRTQVIPTVDQPAVINVKTGVYQEEFPISIPKFTSLVGDELRMSIVEPTPLTSGLDKFYMRDSTTVRNFTFRGATGARRPDGTYDTLTEANQYGTRRPTGGAWISLDPGTGPTDESVWVGARSPYVQNVTTFGDNAVGQKIDGSLHNGGNKSITSNDFTQVMSDSIGAWCTNQGRAELVSVFTYYGYIGYLCENGGVIRATNGNNSYGSYGSVSEGVDPTEISRTSSVDNRRLNAIVERVQTDGADKVLFLEYTNAGEEYTTATYGFEGSGTLNSIVSTPVIQDGGVTEVRILTDGDNYTSVTNNAQAGTNLDIRLGAADIALTNAYNGQRILLIDGAGAGQYAYITSFDGGSKLCTLGMESFTPLEITASTSGTNRLTVADNTTLSVDMPFTVTGTVFGGLATATQYYVKALVGGTQFTVYTDTVTKTAITFTTATGSVLLHKSGWDTIVEGITETITAATKADPVQLTTSVPHAFYTGMEITITGVTGMTQLNGNTYYVSKTGASTFTLYSDPTLLTTVDGTGYTTYISGGTAVGKQPVLEFLNTTSRYVIEPRVLVTTGEGASATAVQTQGINTISVVTGGKGFTVPPEVIISGDGTGSGGFGALATTTISGSVENVVIQDKGSGYIGVPTLTFVGGGLPNGSPNHATATATVTSTIKEVEVTNGGSGYTTPPSVTVTGTGGSGAIISAQISQVVGGVTLTGGINSGGSGYTSAPEVIFEGGEPLVFAEGTAILDAEVTTITVQEGGSGYDPATTTVTIIGTPGAGAQATAVIDFGSYVSGSTPGVITSITVDDGGSGYTTPPTVVIAGDGVDASATANISGSVIDVEITNPGRGYQTAPTVTFSGGGGAGAVGTPTLTGSVISLTVVDGGRNWVGTPNLGFTGGGGSNATANVTAMDTVLDQINLTSSGTGYTSNPAISVTGGKFTYNQTKCSRDIGLMIDAVTTDMVFNSNYKSVFAGLSYLRAYSSVVLNDQKDQTLAAIEEVKQETLSNTSNSTATTRITNLFNTIIDIVDNGLSAVPALTFTSPAGTSATTISAANILQDNRTFIQAEIVAWINKQIADNAGLGGVWDGFTYDDAVCERDVGYIVDGLTFDLLYGGNSSTVDIALSYYYNNTIVAEQPQSILAYGRLKTIVQSIVKNITVTPTTGNTEIQDTSGLPAGSTDDADTLADLMDIIIDVVTNGVPAAPNSISPFYSNGNTTLAGIRLTIQTNKADIQDTVIAWINATYLTSSAIIRARINGAVQTVTVTDPGGQFAVSPQIVFANGNNFKTAFAGLRYYANASGRVAIGLEQKDATLAAIERIRLVARNVARSIAPAATYQTAVARVTGVAGPSGTETAVDAWTKTVYYTIDNGENYTNAETLLSSNREFIRSEAMEFWDANFPGTANATWSRDVGLLVDAVSKDIGSRGVNYTLLAGLKQVFLGTARTTDLTAANAGIDFIRDLALDLVQNEVVALPLTGLTVTATTGTTNYITTTDTTTLSEGDRVIFVGTTFGGITANTIYYIKEVVNGTQFTISTTLDGTVVTLFSSSGTATLSKQFIDDTLTLETGALNAVENLFNYVKELILDDVADATAFAPAAALLLSNKTYIKAEVIAYINTTFTDFDYDQQICARDVGFIVDAMAYDILNAMDANPSVTSATTGVVSSITVNNGGEGYSQGVTITLTGGGSPTTTATATPIINSLTGEITGFTMTNKGRGYTLAPNVVITPDTGSGAFIRAKVVGSVVTGMAIIHPGSGYSAGPCVRLVDANNTEEASFLVRVGDGVLDQPRFTSRGVGYTTADALVDGDGYADIAQVGQFVYVDNLTNIPTPGANIQFTDNDLYYKLVTIREVVGPAGIIGARQLIQDNKEFIQYEILSYLNNFTYDSVKCSRDLGLIIDAIADDYTYDGNSRTLAIQYQYTRGTYAAFDQQRMQTAFALQQLQTEIDDLFNTTFDDGFSVSRKLDDLIEWIKNGESIRALPALDMPNGNFDTQDDRAKNVILANEDFIVAQVIAWMDNNTKIVGRNDTIFEGEIRQIARTIAYDLTYKGNGQTIEFSSSYYVDSSLLIPGVPGTSTAAKSDFLDTLNYINTLLQGIAVNDNITVESGNSETQNQTLTPGDSASQGRINTLMTNFYAIVNSGFAGSGVSLTGSDFTGFLTTSRSTLLGAKSTLQTTIINWITDNFVNFTYDQDVCFRDTGLIVQALADDIFDDVAKSIEAGQRYYAATAALVLSDQRPQTIAAINQIGYIVQKVIRNQTYDRTQTNAFQVRYPSITTGSEAGDHLADLVLYIRRILEVGNRFDAVKQVLLDNKSFIQAETVAYVSASYENLDYNVDLCYRDVGLIIDAICYDIYGGLSRSREAGLRYYQSASALIAITTQYDATVDAIEYVRDIVQAILNDLDPDIAFQERELRVSEPDIVWWVDQLSIDDKINSAFDELLTVIDNGPSSLPPGRYSARLQLSPPLTIDTAPAHNTAMVIRSRYSQVRLTGHDFLNIGTGNKNDTNYPGIPLNAPDQNREIVEQGGGRVFYTSTDQDGNFRVGELFKVEQSTGIATLNADAFNLSGLNELTLGGVNLGGTGATINEFSTDGTFFANSDRIVPTQKAIKTYIQSALGSGGGNIAVNAVTAGDVFITGKEIDTVGGAELSLISADGIAITSTVVSTSTSTGALTVTGGVGILDDVNIGGDVSIQGSLVVTSNGAITVATGTQAQRPIGVTGMLRFNTTISRFEGYNGTGWASIGEGNPWVVKTGSYTAVNGDRLMVNTSAGAFTITLPSSPTIGDTVRFIDGAGTLDLNNLTIGRNGSNIMGESQDLTVSTQNAAFSLVFYNSTYGWRLGEA